MIVYLATNRANGMIYIGATRLHIEVRKAIHRANCRRSRGSQRFPIALREFGVEGFDWQVLETFDDADAMFSAEREWIARLNACDPAVGYNMSAGGRGGDTSAFLTLRGRQVRSESCKRMLRNRPKSLSPAHRAAISKAMRARKAKGLDRTIQPGDRAVLCQMRAEGQSCAKIAKALGVSASAVRAQLKRAAAKGDG